MDNQPEQKIEPVMQPQSPTVQPRPQGILGMSIAEAFGKYNAMNQKERERAFITAMQLVVIGAVGAAFAAAVLGTIVAMIFK